MSDKMTKCKSCGHEISARGKVTCPSCGRVNKKPIYKRVWFIILVVVFGLIIVGNMGTPEKSEITQTSQGNKVIATTKPIPIDVTADELNSALKSNALKASQTYMNKYIRLKGKLSGIDSSGSYFSLSDINSDFSFNNIRCDIEKQHLDIVSNFKAKQLVRVVGTITDVGEIMGYVLEVETIE